MTTKSPLARVKEEFGGKDKLVDKIVGLLGSGDEPKEDMRRRLLGAANSKLVRLHGIANQVKELGGKDELAGAAARELGRGKDKDYVAKLGTFSSGRLVDILQSARRRNKRNGASSPPSDREPAGVSGKAPPVESKRKSETKKAAASKSANASAKDASAAKAAKRKPAKSK
jgi:hypothetical protein